MTLNLVLDRTLLLMGLVWFQLWPSRHYTDWIPAFGEKIYYTLYHKGYHRNQMGVIKALYIVISTALSKTFCCLRRSPVVLLIFTDTIFR